MTIFAIRIFIFSVLPLLLAGTVILIDRTVSSRERRLEVLLIFLFALGVAGSGIGNFFAHFFMSDLVAEAIGWATGSPFQLEIAFANLSIGVLGIIAVGRRDGFREATVVAVTVFGLGATIVHIMDIAATGNLAPGNTLQNVLNIFKPALLITILVLIRRAEATSGSEADTPEFERWGNPIVQASGLIAAFVSSAFGLGFGIDQPVLITILGTIISFIILVIILLRSPWHQIRGLQEGVN